jgi:tRNA-dihydrouridine synthase C
MDSSGLDNRTAVPVLLLAPMEGLLDADLRITLTTVGGVERCVSEFIRVTDQLLPARVFLRLMPELRNGSRTTAGTPVRAQLLGSEPEVMAANAARLAELGAEGVDLNFGCPAPTVNRHRGGAVLLDEPALIHRIASAVRKAVPPAIPVSAKMRLGNRDSSRMVDCAQALQAGGIDELVVHARTKADGYRPPAYWAHLAQIREAVHVPVVANGEIWTADDARRCLAESGCTRLMLGRGMVADPGLARAIRGEAQPSWADLLPLIHDFWLRLAHRVAPRHRAGRLKQWLNLLRRRYPQAQQAFECIRAVSDPQAVTALLFSLEEHAHQPEADAWKSQQHQDAQGIPS